MREISGKGRGTVCLIVLAINVDRNFRYVLCANRDEFHHRPSKGASFWKDDSRIYAGRDLEKGGTWLGVTTDGKIACVTNIRQKEPVKSYRSRGEIVANFLMSDVDCFDYAKTVKTRDDMYRGYNAIVANGDSFVYFSNAVKKLERLTDGFYTLSNATLHTIWPKEVKAKQLVENALKQNKREESLIDELVARFYDQTVFADEWLPNTGVGIERERFLSPIFIKDETYGTRATTVVLKK